MEIPEPASVAVEHQGNDPGLHVVAPVGDSGGVRQIEGVDLEGQELAVPEGDLEVLDDRSPDVELGDVDAVEGSEDPRGDT